MNDAEQLAYDLFSAAAIEGAADARFMMLTLTIHGDLAGTCVGTEKGAPDLGE
jgi:hypothetical protein